MDLTTHLTARPQFETPRERSTNSADEMREVQYREQAIFLDIWHLNSGDRRGASMLEMGRMLGRLTKEATRIFQHEEQYLRQLKPSQYPMHRAAHDRILRDLRVLETSLLEGEQNPAVDFDQVLTEFLIHCVCNDPSLDRGILFSNAASQSFSGRAAQFEKASIQARMR